MKTVIAAAAAAILGVGIAPAQETVKTLYQGDVVNVTWENTMTITPDSFADEVNVGDYISIGLVDATDVVEIKGNGVWLPGSILQRVDGKSEYRAYITSDMLAALKQYGMEICGASFGVNAVAIMNDGFQMPEGAIWGGYFWIDNWNTLELWKTAFDSYNGQRYLDINMEASNSDYVLNVMTRFDDPDAVWSKSETTVKTSSTATIDLKGIDVKESLADVNALLCQLNPEGGEPFNVTSIVLRGGDDTSTDTPEIDMADDTATVDVYNLQGMAVRRNVNAADALVGMPQGIYIVNGRKHIVK